MGRAFRRGIRSAVIAAFAALTATAGAAVIVNDTFQDATRTDPASPVYSENGVDADADNSIESAWFRSGTGSSTTMSVGHMVNAAGAGASMSLTTYMSPGKITLNNVGDKMTITWVFTPTGTSTTSTGNQDMRIAIVDSPTRITSDATPISQAYTGYAMYFNMRADTIGANNAFRIMEWAGGTNNLLSTAAAYSQDAAMATVAGTTPGFVDGTSYTLTWSIEKTAAGADINQSIVGGNVNLSASFSDTSPQPLSFDTFGMRPQTPELTAASFDTTLFKVEGPAVPEPASIGLIGLAGMMLARRRARA
jgi:hypothetical protein